MNRCRASRRRRVRPTGRSKSASRCAWRCSASIVIVGSLQVGINWGAEGPKAGFFPFYIGADHHRCPASSISSRHLRRDASDGLFAEWSQLAPGDVGGGPDRGLCRVDSVHRHLCRRRSLLIAVFMRWLGRYGWPMVARGLDRRAGRHLRHVREVVPRAAAEGADRGMAGLLSASAVTSDRSRCGQEQRTWKKSPICFTASPSSCSRSTSC